MWSLAVAVACVWAGWSLFIFWVQAVGIWTIFRHYSRPPAPSVSTTDLEEDEVPHVTIIRPVKGLDAGLYDCLASTFRQTYPKTKTTIFLCVNSSEDPAYPVLKKLVADFPEIDAHVLVETEDPLAQSADHGYHKLGPNPKIRNIRRAYREAKGDILWIVDCNVWIGKGVLGRMVDKLCGYRPNGQKATPYKFVHQLPLVIDVATPTEGESESLLQTAGTAGPEGDHLVASAPRPPSTNTGGRLEEMFISTSHAKFYSAINTVGVAPCICGKSNMFRKSHLEQCTDPSQHPGIATKVASWGRGIDFFSHYICEDHMIGDLLWKTTIPGFLNHGLVYGDVAVQPVAGMSTYAFIARRIRWLRVRKWSVILATLVEPGVEPALCLFYFSFSLTTLPWVHETFGVPQTWLAMLLVWLGTMVAWMSVDRCVSMKLHRLQSVEVDENTPRFARGTSRPDGTPAKPLSAWVYSWIGREVLTLPIWIWAFLGQKVAWRGKTFRVRLDMSAVEVEDNKSAFYGQGSAASAPSEGRRSRSKDRVD